MANDDDKKSDSTKSGTTGTGTNKTSKTGTGRARARPKKPPLTIDLEAKDITEGGEPKKVSVRPARPASKTSQTKSEQAEPEQSADQKVSGSKASPATSAGNKSTSSEVNDKKSDSVNESATEKRPQGNAKLKAEASLSGGEPPKTTKDDAVASSSSKNSSATEANERRAPEQKKSNIAGTLIAASIGGLVAIGGFYGLQTVGVAPTPSTVVDLSPDLADLEARLADVEASINQPQGNGNVEALENRLNEVESLAQTAAQNAENAVSLVENIEIPEPTTATEISSEMIARLDVLESRMASVEQGATTFNADEANIPDSDGTTPPAGSDVINERLATLEARLSAEEKKALPEPEVSKSAFEQLGADVGEAANRLVALEDSLKAVKETLDGLPRNDFGPIEASVSELGQNIVSLESKLSSLQDNHEGHDKQFSEIGDMTSRINADTQALSGQVEANMAALAKIQSAAQSIALANFQTIAVTGGSFEKALNALETSGIPADQLAPLQPFATRGVKDETLLGEELSDLLIQAAALKTSEPTETQPSSALEKLFQNATSAIGVRKVGDVAVEEQSILKKLQESFDAKNIVAFEEAIAELNEKQSEVFSAWLDEWRANLALKELAKTIEPSSQGVQSEPNSQ